MAPRKWTRDRIIAEIKSLYAAGESLAVYNVRRLGYGGMVSAVYNDPTMGSWSAAIKAAGLAYEEAAPRRHKWTPERIIATIRQLDAQSEDLSYNHIKRIHQYLLVAAQYPHNFGSWQAAIGAAGLDYQRIRQR